MKELSKADREYAEKLRKQSKIYLVTILFMLSCSGILFVGTNWYKLKISEHAVGYLLGFFLSISVAFIIFIFRNQRTIRNPEKLKQQRIARTDERNLEISNLALKVTAYILAVVLVILSMIGSFISESLMITASSLLYVFLFSYLICCLYFRKKL